MASITVPFSENHVDDAAQLLAINHTEHRKTIAFLPSDFEVLDSARMAIAEAWEKKNTSGYALLDTGKLTGYMFGQLRVDTTHRSGWVPQAGYAVVELADATATYQLYAALSEDWVQQGAFEHFMMLPLGIQSLRETWYDLGFVQQQAHAVMSLADYHGVDVTVDDLTIRAPQPEDAEALASMSGVIACYQMRSPTFALLLPEFRAEIREGYAGLVTDDDATVWLAELDGEVVGFAVYYKVKADPTDMMHPSKSIELAVQGTIEAVRGRGVGLALTAYGLCEAKQAGYEYVVSDWRTANLLSSRFWRNRGFEPTVYRMNRWIDHRLLWTRC